MILVGFFSAYTVTEVVFWTPISLKSDR